MTLDGWATVVGTLTLVFTVVLTALGRFATWWYHRLFPAKLAEFDKIECAPMFRGHLKPSFDLIQVWFNNKERAQLAKDVSAYVEVFDVDNAPLSGQAKRQRSTSFRTTSPSN